MRCVCTMLVCICVEFAEICCCVTVSGCVSLCVLFWRSFVCCVCGSGDVRGWRGCCRSGDVWKFV